LGATLKQRTLGRTGLPVSEIGFGCGPTGGLMIRAGAAERRDAVALALDLGINYFDTAPGYGANASECHLGEALHQLNARPCIATKVALSLEDLADIGASIRRSVEASLRRLRVDELAVIQLHNRVGAARAARAPFGTGALLAIEDVMGPGGVVEAFERLRSKGLVRHFGFSAFGGDMSLIERLIDSNTIEVLTTHYSMLNRTAWSGPAMGDELDYREVGKRAVSRGMGSVVLRVLEGGILTSPAPASMSRARRLASLMDAADLDVAEGAVRFALSNSKIGVVLIGFSDAERIRQATNYAGQGPLPPPLRALIEET
jgi:aryl-alcohol dehydrogenase-like predicted oxidoreductase